MKSYAKRYWFLAASLAALAGYVDAIGFIKLGGLFVSFMSGNSTRFAVEVARRSSDAPLAGGLIAAFLAGVAAGSVVGELTGAVRKSTVLALVCLCLIAAAALDGAGADRPCALLLALGMGAMNCVFQRGGEVSIGVTYMTGALVKLGQHLVAAFLGRDRLGWMPYFLLWGSLVCGAVVGGASYPRIGSAGLWIAALAAALLAGTAHLMGRPRPAAS